MMKHCSLRFFEELPNIGTNEQSFFITRLRKDLCLQVYGQGKPQIECENATPFLKLSTVVRTCCFCYWLLNVVYVRPERQASIWNFRMERIAALFRMLHPNSTTGTTMYSITMHNC